MVGAVVKIVYGVFCDVLVWFLSVGETCCEALSTRMKASISLFAIFGKDFPSKQSNVNIPSFASLQENGDLLYAQSEG